VIHPSPLTAYKRWPTQKWKELIEIIGKNYQIVLSAGPDSQDKKLNEEIISLIDPASRKNVINLNGSLQLNELGTLLRGTKLYIGVDTSVTHLAAACNIPTITLFGATPPTNFGPWPNGFIGKQPYQLRQQIQCIKNVTIIQGPGNCVPCRKAGCEDHANSKSDCLINLPIEWILDAARQYGINI
jgi:heptosyltransferase-3